MKVRGMKWHNFGLLLLVACTLSGLLGWYIGGLENKFFGAAAVVIVCVASCAICLFTDIRRKFPAYSLIDSSCIVTYWAAALISHYRHLPPPYGF